MSETFRADSTALDLAFGYLSPCRDQGNPNQMDVGSAQS